MSSVVRTTQMPYFSFHRSSTPIPYSLGKPTLNCCGGSLSTLGNMNRPVAASAAADAPHARPIHARRVRSGDVSSGSRAGAAAAVFAGAGAGAALAAAPPAEATVVVLPARSGPAAGGGFGTTGRAGCAPVAAAAAAVAASDAPAGAGLTCGGAAGLAPVGGALGIGGFVSSAISSFLIDDLGIDD